MIGMRAKYEVIRGVNLAKFDASMYLAYRRGVC